MPLNVSSEAIIEKNKITSDGTWLLLIEFNYEDEESVRICLNGESVEWDSYTWYPAIFSLSDIVENKDGEIPVIPLTITDINRTLIPILEEYNGGIGAEVIIRIVHSKYLSNLTPEFEEITEVIDTVVDDSAKITFKLGAENLIDRRCPQQRYLKNNCRFIFKRTSIQFSSGGILELTPDYWIKGDTSGDTAKIIDVKLSSGIFANGTAAGELVIQTLSGPFQIETFSAYTDADCLILAQSDTGTVATISSGKCGYTGAEIACNRSFQRCEELNNKTRFGGFIGVGATGFLK